MNHAEDRRDRKARDGFLASDYAQSLGDHGARAATVRDAGWNRAAVYHYGVAWCENPSRASSAGDYAAMADLAGFPELGLVALLVYRRMTMASLRDRDDAGARTFKELHLLMRLDEIPDAGCWADPVDYSVVFDSCTSRSQCRDCGCGQAGCGGPAWMIPMTETAIEVVLQCLEEYASNRVALHYHWQEREHIPSRQQSAIPTAHNLIKMLADGVLDVRNFNDTVLPAIPTLLQFWEKDDADDRPLPSELQLLMIKLLFQVLPSLAIEAVVCLRLDDNGNNTLSTVLSQRYKSHYAYYIFVKALVLGIRIKPHRKRLQKYYHVPLWDRLWGLGDDYNNNNNLSDNKSPGADQQPAKQFATNLRKLLRGLRDGSNNIIEVGSLSLVWIPPFRNVVCSKPLFLAGDSHVFSLAWNTVQLPNSLHHRLVIPVVVTGLKAWHVRSSTRFFTRSSLEIILQRLDCETILFSAGEIDCREGLGGPLLEGYTQACHDHVVNTVKEYVKALDEIVQDNRNKISQILVLPVAPHLYRTTGRIEAQVSRRETMRVWNAELRRILQRQNSIHLLDYADKLQAKEHPGVFALNPAFNADSTHMNSAFIPVFEQAIEECGCNVNAL